MLSVWGSAFRWFWGREMAVESKNLHARFINSFHINKYDVVNEAFTRLDGAIAGKLVVTVPNGGDTSISETDFRWNYIFDVTGSLSAAENINIPAIEKQFWIRNDTSPAVETVICQVEGGNGDTVELLQEQWNHIYSDGTNLTLMGTPVDWSVGYAVPTSGTGYANSEILYRSITRRGTLVTELTGSQFRLGTAPNGNGSGTGSPHASGAWVLGFYRAFADGTGESSIGSIGFNSGSKTPSTVSFVTDVGFRDHMLILKADAAAASDSANLLGYSLSFLNSGEF